MKHHVFSNVLKVDFFSFLKTVSLMGLNSITIRRIEFYQFHPEIENKNNLWCLWVLVVKRS